MWAGRQASKERERWNVHWKVLASFRLCSANKKKLIHQVFFVKIYLKLTLQHSEPLRFGSQFAMAIYGTKGLNLLDDENSTRKVIQPIQCVNVGKVTYLCQRSCWIFRFYMPALTWEFLQHGEYFRRLYTQLWSNSSDCFREKIFKKITLKILGFQSGNKIAIPDDLFMVISFYCSLSLKILFNVENIFCVGCRPSVSFLFFLCYIRM